MKTLVKYNASPNLIEMFKKKKKTSVAQKSLSKAEQELKPIPSRVKIVPKPKKLSQVKLMGVTVSGKAQPKAEVVNVKHDDHYSKVQIQAINIMEQVVEENTAVPMKARLNIAMALKYQVRVGMKHGEDWKKELQKSINYLNRAITGQWVD